MDFSNNIVNLSKALLAFQSKMGKISKESKNPFFKSKYASLSTILSNIQEPLAEAGLTITQFPTGENGLCTMLIHAETGEYLMDTFIMTPAKKDPQSQGSLITYQRRYALGAILALNIDDDDDANKVSLTDPELGKSNGARQVITTPKGVTSIH